MPETTDWLCLTGMTGWLTDWATGRLSNWLACSSFLPQAEIGKLPQTLCTSTAARQVQRGDANWHKLKNLYMVQAIFHCCCLSCCCCLWCCCFCWCCCYWPRHFHFARAGSSDSGRGFFYFPISFWFCVQIKIEKKLKIVSFTHTHTAACASITNDILSAWLAFAGTGTRTGTGTGTPTWHCGLWLRTARLTQQCCPQNGSSDFSFLPETNL